ncbi:hypothetical protein [Nocardia pneumoniae]|uniref:hypothetical protein n=1 Tax=Nocardia pneumoniae TaxID=228601 RepID=UPI0005940DF1|nr:hypothetical protein [Nocardia pneumoniae]
MSTSGSGSTVVREEDLRRLLAMSEPNARLVLEEGRVRIEQGSDTEPRGMLLATRADLADRLGDDPDAAALTEQATELNSEIRLRGA